MARREELGREAVRRGITRGQASSRLEAGFGRRKNATLGVAKANCSGATLGGDLHFRLYQCPLRGAGPLIAARPSEIFVFSGGMFSASDRMRLAMATKPDFVT